MKTRLLFLLTLIVFSTALYAQFDKGNLYLQGSGNLNFSSEKRSEFSGGVTSEASKAIYFGLNPKVGYFLIKNMPLGLKMDAAFFKSKYSDMKTEYSSSELLMGPFARYYFFEQDKLKPMAEVFLGIGMLNSKSDYGGSLAYESKRSAFGYGIGAGASYFLTDDIAFDFMLNYNYVKYTIKSSTMPEVKSTPADDKIGEIYSGVRAEFGVIVILPKK